jgi:hypothetical protein
MMSIKNRVLCTMLFLGVCIASCDIKQQKTISEEIVSAKAAEPKRADTAFNSVKGQVKEFTIDPKKKNNLLSKKGIKIAIPENAFVTSNGKTPEGTVSVTVSEYHNPADILASGINMQYNTAEGPIQMESAGMFNMQASCEGKPLQIAQNKKIDIEVPSTNKDIDFNLYYFDTLTNTWTETQKILPVKEKQQEQTIVTSLKKENEADPQMTIEWAASKPVQRRINGKVISLVKPDCMYDNTFFTIPLMTDQYPELALYKEAVWTGYLTQDKMKVAAAFEVDQLISAKIVERETPLNKYLVSMEFKNIKITAYMKIASRPEQCETNEELYTAYLNERPVDEARIEKIENKRKVQKKTDEIYRAFSITRMGLWNCDRLYVLTKKSLVHARFRNASTNEFYTPQTTYLIDKNINSVWVYNTTIVLNPDSDNVILVVTDKGKICYTQLNKLSETRDEKEMALTIDVNEMTDKPNNTEDLYLLIRKKM